MKELKDLRIDVNKDYIGFSPNGDKIKQIHIAGGALRVIYGKTLDTSKIKTLAFVAGKKDNKPPKGSEPEAVKKLIEEEDCFNVDPSDDDLLSFRTMLQRLLNTDNGMFPDDGQLTYSAGSKYFIKGKAQYEDAGEFIGGIIETYCTELSEYIKELLDKAEDPISVLLSPVVDESDKEYVAPNKHLDLQAFIEPSAAMKWYLKGLKDSSECLMGNLKKMPNTLSQIRMFVFFCSIQLMRYLSLLEAFYCNGQILPFLLDFSDSPNSGIASASTASYARVYQSLSRFHSWAFAQQLKDIPKIDLMHMDTPIYDTDKAKREDQKAVTQKKKEKLAAERAEFDIQWKFAQDNARDLDEEAAKLEFGKTLYNMTSMQASSYPVSYLRALGIQGGIVYPIQRDSKRKRFKLTQDTFEMIIKSCVENGEIITYDELCERMWNRFNITVNGIPVSAFSNQDICHYIQQDTELGSDMIEDNHQRCVRVLENMDFADLMADGMLRVHLGGTN